MKFACSVVVVCLVTVAEKYKVNTDERFKNNGGNVGTQLVQSHTKSGNTE